MNATGFDSVLKATDLVITGEGKIDNQSLDGKLIKGVADHAAVHEIPVIAFCGTLEADPEHIKKLGIAAAFSILQKPATLDESIEHATTGLENLAFNVVRSILKFHRNEEP